MKPLFEEHADATYARAREIYAGRGVEYGDTWRETRFLKMEAVARALGLNIDKSSFRALATAAFCDMKYWRFLGGYKDDSVIDGMNYDAFLAEDMQRLLTARQSMVQTGSSGDWFQTYTGKQFYPCDPRVEDICIEDIAHALAHICRFGGHVKNYYSVAQHSVLVSEYCAPHLQLIGLMHDAAEAYLGDMVRPLKLQMERFREAEAKVWIAICERFSLDPAQEPLIKDMDDSALMTERRDLLTDTGYNWSVKAKAFPEIIEPWSPEDAEIKFLVRWDYLTSQKE